MAFLGWSHRSGTSKVPLHSQQDAAARCGFFFFDAVFVVIEILTYEETGRLSSDLAVTVVTGHSDNSDDS